MMCLHHFGEKHPGFIYSLSSSITGRKAAQSASITPSLGRREPGVEEGILMGLFLHFRCGAAR